LRYKQCLVKSCAIGGAAGGCLRGVIRPGGENTAFGSILGSALWHRQVAIIGKQMDRQAEGTFEKDLKKCKNRTCRRRYKNTLTQD